MMHSVKNFGRASEWDDMSRACFVTTVFITLHWLVSQHAMRSSANGVSYHREAWEQTGSKLGLR